MDADLIVVGAGVVGSFAARAGRAKGLEVLHLAAATPPHSLAAAAVTRPTYLPPGRRGELSKTLKTYGSAVTCADAFVTSYRTPEQRPKHQEGWWLIDPATPLEKPNVTASVEHVQPGAVTTAGGQRYTCRAIVLATGATSRLSPEGKITWGMTWTGPMNALAYPDALRIHHWAPYKAISAGPAGGIARIGSSSGRTRAVAEEAGDRLLALAEGAGLLRRRNAFIPLLGARLKTVETVQRRDRAVYWAGGHHRNGYALGPADAARAVRLATLEDAGR